MSVGRAGERTKEIQNYSCAENDKIMRLRLDWIIQGWNYLGGGKIIFDASPEGGFIRGE